MSNGTPASPAKKQSKLENALDAASRGFRVFPVCRDDKVPAIEGWQTKATTNAGQIETWWSQNPNWNIGIATGDGLLVIDVDVKNGQPGTSSLEMLEMMGLPETMRVRTPTGGLHVYVRTDRKRTGRAGVIRGFPGLDTRGDGNLVLWPGSYIGRRPYTLEHDVEIADGPMWLLDAMQETVTKQADRVEDFATEPDLTENVARAIDYLKNRAPAAVQGAGGDHTTYYVAAELRALGISEGMSLELMLDHWNEAKASPPWDPDELAKKVSNGHRYGQGALGGKTAAGEFGTLDIDIGEPPRGTLHAVMEAADRGRRASAAAKFRMLNLAEAVAAADGAGAEPLVDGLLDQGTLAVMYGKPNSGKSFVALDLGAHIAAGRPWNGMETAAGLCIYVAAEGGGSFFRRVKAVVQEKGLPADTPFYASASAVDLFSRDADLSSVVAEIGRLKMETGLPCRLVVLDTLARVMGGGDENSGKDMGQLIANLDRLRIATAATVLAIHHSGKDAAKGARGHSALLGAVDTEIEIVDRKIRTTKQRDNAPLDPDIRFDLSRVSLGEDHRGRPVGTCIVRYPGADEFEPMPLSDPAERLKKVLADLLSAADRPAATLDEWNRAARVATDSEWREGTRPPKGCSDKNLRTLRSELIESGHVAAVGNDRFKMLGAAR